MAKGKGRGRGGGQRTTTKPRPQRKASPSSQASGGHLARFLMHGLVFVPILFVFVLSVFDDVDLGVIGLWTIFAATTVSLEICWSCYLKQDELAEFFEECARESSGKPQQTWIRRLSITKVRKNFYLVLSVTTLIGWGLIAFCEERHLTGGHLGPSKIIGAGAFASFNLFAAIGKLWVTTKDEWKFSAEHVDLGDE
jgi:hypothetical protein